MIKEILNKIKQSNSIGIVMHDNPDGDAVGSAIALKHILKQFNKDAIIIKQNKINPLYKPLLNEQRFVPKKFFDLMFVVDCSDLNRISFKFDNVASTIIAIDHHFGSKPYGDIYWCEEVVSTGILIYKFIKEANLQITSDIATALYLSIKTDTCDFRNDNVDGETFRITADIVDHKPNMNLIQEITSYTREFLNLQKEVWQNLMYDNQYKIVYTTITKKQIENNGGNFAMASSIINILRMLENINIAVVFIECGHKVFVKVRSKTIDVSNIMQEFGGGGHRHASGAVCYTDSTYSLVYHIISRIQQEIKNANI